MRFLVPPKNHAMQSEKALLTEGPVGKRLVTMTVPVLLGITTMMGQALIDAWFLGRVGDRALAAHAFSFPILLIVSSVAIGLGAGTSSVVARAIGSNDYRRARRLTTDSLLLSFLITVAVSLLGVVTIAPLFRLLGAPDDMIPMIRSFMIILYAGVPFVVVGMVGLASMRATGDTRLPSKLMIFGSILNVALDPILIFGLGPIPGFGLNGAAMAALLARGTIFVGAVVLLRGRLNMISFSMPHADELKKSWKDILHVGLPAAGTNAIVPIGAAIVTAMIARYGPDAVAGFGVASRIESMTLVVYYAMSAIIGPFVGQNFSAGKDERIVRALDWLGEQQQLEVKVAGIRHRYQCLQQPASTEELATELHQRILKREQAEIHRLQQVLNLIELDNCQTNALAAHFGELRQQACGHCSWCQRGKSDIPPRHAPVISKDILQEAYGLQREQAEVLTTPRLLTRFLCGISSPRLSRSKLNAHALFGSLENAAFAEVLARTAQDRP